VSCYVTPRCLVDMYNVSDQTCSPDCKLKLVVKPTVCGFVVLVLLLLVLVFLLSLQFLVDHSLFKNCPSPPLCSRSCHLRLQFLTAIFRSSSTDSSHLLRFSCTSSAFCYNNSKLSARTLFLYSKAGSTLIT